MEYQITTSRNLPPGCTFSDATDIYKKSGKKNLFEELITLKTIEEDSNLIDAEKERLITILNSNIDPFEKRIEDLLARFAFLPEALAAEDAAVEEPAAVKPVLPFLKTDGSIACANGERNYFYYAALGTCGHKRTGASCPAADDKPVKVTAADGKATSYCVPFASWTPCRPVRPGTTRARAS